MVKNKNPYTSVLLFRSLWLCVIFFFSAVSVAVSQEGDFTFRHFSISDGLSQSSVISIMQDKKGLIWFGTRDGLNKYDGQKFTVYKHDKNDSSSISNNDITSIIKDAKGDLWIGTFNGLNKYNYSKDRFEQFFNNTADSTTISDNSIWTIFESDNGDIWVGTANGLNRYNKSEGKFERFYHDPKNKHSLSDNYIVDIFQDSEGMIWIATAEGLNKMNVDNGGRAYFVRYLHQSGDTTSLSDNYTQTIAEDANGNLWIGTKYGGLNKFNKRTNSFEVFKHDPEIPNSISNNDVRCLSFDKTGKLWIGTYSGLNLMKVKEKHFHRFLNDKDDPNTLSKNSVKSMFIDVNGSLWVGTYYGGINLLDPQNSNFRNYKYQPNLTSLNFEVISAIIEDKEGNVYFGTEGGGVNVLDSRTKKFNYIKRDNTANAISNNNIKSLYLDKKEHLWIGTYNGGLNIFNLKTGAVSHYKNDPKNKASLSDNDIYSIVQQNDSLFWLGTHGGGLNLFNRNSGRFTHFREGLSPRLTSDLIRVLFKDSNGNLWIGTQYGLNFLSHKDISTNNVKFKNYFYDWKKLTGEDILTIFEDSQSRIWVGTNESGLNLLDPKTDKFLNFSLYKISGSTTNVVHGILEDNSQSLWLSTNQGIIKLNPNDSTFKKFDESDGLVANEYNNSSCLKNSKGEMYFGSFQGVTNFHPDSIITNKHAPPVVLTDFKLFGQSIKAGSKDGVLDRIISNTRKVALEYDQAIFTIGFAIPNYINPDKNFYAYRLKGLEEQWNISSDNSATYTIQRPGDYVFEVKGANNDGVWNTEPTTLTVTVNPAPWRTWWAFLAYGIIISIALYLLVNIILSRSKLKHELDLEHVNKEKQESLNQMKLQFFTNISHEFRTPLVLILGPLEQMITNYRGSNKLYKQLVAIEKNANRLLKLIDQLMDFRKFENKHFQLRAAEGNIVDFVKEIYLSFKQFAKVHGFNYEFSSQTDSIMLWFDRDKMERVVFNLISNAFKYTPEEGSIAVSVRQLHDVVEITVTDNGVGMEQEHLDKIFERFYEVEPSKNLLNTKYNKGTGIGLALTKGIVDLHFGKINVESKKDIGSTFTVKLPLGSSHLKETQIIKDFKNSEDITNYEIKSYLADQAEEFVNIPDLPVDGPTLLIVEDNDEVRKYLVMIFKDQYNVKEAANGKEGLKQALQIMPDIILSDVMMPEMDGIEFCSQVKSNLKTSHIPFILLTARTSLIFKFEGLEMGADDYINKPFNVKELQIKVRNHIKAQKKLKEKFTSESIVKPSEITVSSIDEKMLEKALKIVDENISNEMFDIPTFCEELGVSRTMLFAKIKAWTNLTPNEFIQVMRIKRAAQLLEQNKLNVAQIGFKVGFRNPKYFSKCFQRYYTVTPTIYAKKFSDPDEIEATED
ncbi:MAG TPA: two-component regulator propeller domain-containing protein [Cytophagales bacterium]|nr:two-component regulator propeller domain-containing protein [Cytophagales bacterium]